MVKPLKAVLYEFRVRHTAHDIVSMNVSAGQVPPATPEKILLRVFVHSYGQQVILLLHGYDKEVHIHGVPYDPMGWFGGSKSSQSQFCP
jgi:hypothetical protein